MNKIETEFLDDILEALDDYVLTYDYDTYHLDDFGRKMFCIDVTINYEEEEAEIIDDIEDSISDVCDEWYEAHYDRPAMNEFNIALYLDD